MTNPVVVVGGDAIAQGAAPLLRQLAKERRVGMLNTFAAKGLFAWDDPAHLGTIGLQERDLELAGFAEADVVLVGVPEHEVGRDWLDSVGARWVDVEAATLGSRLLANDVATPRPLLYRALADVCGPMYSSESLPTNPARAAADLAAWLPSGGVVQAHHDAAGFWIGRAFPTRELGSVRFGEWTGAPRPVVHIVTAIDEADRDGIVEVWSPTGPRLTRSERLDRLTEAAGRAEPTVLELGVDDTAIDTLIAVAGAPLWPRFTI